MPMNSRNRKFVLIGGLLGIAAVGSTVWAKRRELFPDPVMKEIRSARSELRHLSGDAAEREKVRRVNALYEATLAKHPGLAVTYKDVPDDRNGYLKWRQFEQRYPNGSLDLPEDIRRMINGEDWDADKVAAWMKEHADLIAEIMEIGLTPDQSAKGVGFPKDGFVQAKLAKEAADLLLMRARLEAERGSTETSFQSLQATMGLANHLDQIETPSLLHATVSILLRLGASHQFFENVLPALPGDALDLSAWQQNFGATSSPEEFGRLLIGEWHTGSRHIALPAMVSGEAEWKDVSDPEVFLDRWADWVEAQVQGCESTDLSHLSDTLGGIHAETDGIGSHSIGMLEVMETGLTAWSKGWVRSQIVWQQQNAAFAHLRGEPLMNEPITGKPFVWDETSQSVRLPEDERLKDFDVKPLVIKRSH
jgi:hypothetical protein